MSGGGILGGVIGGILGFFIAGPIGILLYGALGYFAGASATASKSVGGSAMKDAVAGEFEMTSSSETITAPVIFGIMRNPGNYLEYDKATFRTEPITETQTASGGKGGGKKESVTTVTGYRYYMSFDVGLCMGPVRRLRALYDGSKMKKVAEAQEFSGDSVLFHAGNDESSGNVRLYKGTMTQTRVVNEPYSRDDNNYRGTCFACFQNFFIGNSSQPRSYLFELQRWPEVKYDSGETIAGFSYRGSENPAHDAYEDANPAAIIYEIMTNKEWGCGLSSDLFEIESWKKTAAYYAAQGIGLSMSLEAQQGINDVIDAIRQHVNMVVIWDGFQLSAKCLMDAAVNTVIDDTLTNDVVKDVKFSRPAWPTMTNELKLKFINRSANFKDELVQVQNTAAINTAGIINSRAVDMKAYPSREIAEAQAARMLAEFSYPQATLQFTLTRNTRARAGSLIQFETDEWSEGNAVTFWRIDKITDRLDGDGLQVEAREDLYATAYEGEAVTHQPLVPAFESGGFRTDGDLNLGGSPDAEPGSIAPVILAEQNIWMTQGAPLIVIGAEDGGSGQTAYANYWQLDSGGDKNLIGPSHGLGVTGELVTAIPGTGRELCRQTEFAFRISFTNAAAAVKLLASANKTPLASDHFQTITAGQTDLLLIGKEIFQLGKVVATEVDGVYEVQAYLRAQYGTEMEAHAIGDKWLFIQKWSTAFELRLPEALPEDADVNIIQHAVTSHTESSAEYEAPGPYDGRFVRLGLRPFTPSLISRAVDGDDWTVVVRPRWHADGAFAFSNFNQDALHLLTAIPAGYTFILQAFASGVALADAELATPVYTPADGMTGNGGRLTFEKTVTGADELRIWTVYNGKKSLLPLSVPAS